MASGLLSSPLQVARAMLLAVRSTGLDSERVAVFCSWAFTPAATAIPPSSQPHPTPTPTAVRRSGGILRSRVPPHWDATGAWPVRPNKATSVVHGVETASQCGGFDAPFQPPHRDAAAGATWRARRGVRRAHGKRKPPVRPGVLCGRSSSIHSQLPDCPRDDAEFAAFKRISRRFRLTPLQCLTSPKTSQSLFLDEPPPLPLELKLTQRGLEAPNANGETSGSLRVSLSGPHALGRRRRKCRDYLG